MQSDAVILPATPETLSEAAARLRSGDLVAFPTETVYGLGANALDSAAVARIFAAKGRPSTNPVIVHVADPEGATAVVAEWPEAAQKLADAFWPGPLTLVLPLKEEAGIAPAVTAGLPTIALRCPAHPVMRAVLQATGLPLAAPSANRSGAVSPTAADHVLETLNGRIDAVLDGGPCERGLESTIVAVRPEGWQMLRAGPIAERELIALLAAPLPVSDARIESPGQLAQHYSPGKPVRLNARGSEADEFLIGFGAIEGDCNLSPTGNLNQAAARLYACLHAAAASHHPKVAVVEIADEGIGAAINDRLRRAAN
jgi:L-threonylcarbamoyladenylate synthase